MQINIKNKKKKKILSSCACPIFLITNKQTKILNGCILSCASNYPINKSRKIPSNSKLIGQNLKKKQTNIESNENPLIIFPGIQQSKKRTSEIGESKCSNTLQLHTTNKQRTSKAKRNANSWLCVSCSEQAILLLRLGGNNHYQKVSR